MRFALLSVLLLCAMATQTGAATITVTNTNDSGPGSLRQALANANNGDRINFAVTGAISLTSGGLGITKNVTISGPGFNQLAVNGNQAFFVFGVFPQRTVSISGLRIRNAQVGVYNNQGTVSVSNCVLSGNSSAGLHNHAGASMTVANSNISNNSGTGADNQGTLTVSSCVLSGNSNAGISNSGTVTVSNCALSGNSGGMSSFGTLTANNCIVRGNSGDGIFNGGTLTVSNCDISGNSGDGIGNHAFSSGTANLTIVNSNVSDNDSIGISNSTDEFGTLTVTIRSTTVSGNSVGGVVANGGGVIFGGSIQVTITDCAVSGNSFWGGIHATGLTNLFVTDSTISGNSANAGFPDGDSGGAIYGAGTVRVENSTISGNSAATSGGGIYGGVIEIVNSTISGNSAGTSGGGIYNFPYSLNVANSTITGNSAPSGGGIYNKRPPVGDSVVEISNTILNAGASGENIFNDGGTISSLGYNLSSDDGGGYLTGPGDQINTDPLLGPLQDNGGPTFTHALLPGSPAIDAGDPNFHSPPLNDQRGCPRVINGRIDIGSFERQPLGRSCVTPQPRPTPRPRPTSPQ
jgi:predicted outer membrane repeat protein